MLIETLFVISLNEPLPMRASFASPRWAESTFWIVAAIGAAFATDRATYELNPPQVLFIDLLVPVAVTGIVAHVNGHRARGVQLTESRKSSLHNLPNDRYRKMPLWRSD
jgi:hypothetical protein